MSRIISIFLQLSQRLGAIALLATLGAWTMLFLEKDVSMTLAVVAAAADAGLCSALLARAFCQPKSPDRQETNSVAIFNLALLVLAVYLMVFTRVDVIRAAATQFFTPPVQAENAHISQP